MKKKYILFIFVIALAGFAVWLTASQNNSTLKNDFVLYDTASVTKIFIADKDNNSVTLSRTDTSGWRLQNGKKATKENVDILLRTFMDIQIKYPVSKSAFNTSVKRLATNSVKVEIYTKKPLIDILGLKLFTKERLDKVYYVGGPTADYKGTIMKTGKGDKIYVTGIPGFNGYLTERYSSKIADWQDHTVFNIVVGNIKTVSVDFPETPKESYRIINNGNRTFTIQKAQENYADAGPYDTLRVLQMLAAFNSINYESLLDDMPAHRKDSLLKSIPYRIVSLTDFSGKTMKIKLYHRPNFGKITDIDGKPFPFDVDRLYGLTNTDTNFVTMQFFVTDNITRPLSYLLHKDKTDSTKYSSEQLTK